MKMEMKRIVALLIAFVMAVGVLWTGDEQVSNAATTNEDVQTVWTICENEKLSSGGLSKTALNISLGEYAQDMSKLSLYVRMTVTDKAFNAGANTDPYQTKWRMKIDNEQNDSAPLFVVEIPKSGEFEHTYSFAELYNYTTPNIDLSKPINYFGLWKINADCSDMFISEIKIIYTPNEWTLYKNKTITNSTNIDNTSLNMNLNKANANKNEYTLHFKVTVPDSVVTQNGYDSSKWRVKLYNVADVEATATLVPTGITSAGTYEYTVKLSDIAPNNNNFDISKALKRCRVYIDNLSAQDVVIDEMKIVFTSNEWTLYKNKTITESSLTDSSFNIDFNRPSGEQTGLVFYVKMTVPSSIIENSSYNTTNWRIKLSHTIDQESDACLVPTITTAGTHEFTVKMSEINPNGQLNIASTLKRCRIYLNGGLSVQGVTIDEMKIIDTTAYVEEYQSKYWSVLENQEITNVKYDTTNLGFSFNEQVNRDNLALWVKLDIPSELGEKVLNDDYWRIKICNEATKRDTPSEHGYKLIPTTTGENTFVIPLYTADNLDCANTINSLRIYHNVNGEDTDLKGVKFSVRIIDTRYWVEPGKTPDAVYADTFSVPTGYTFAGWYTDSSCTSANALKDMTNGTVYAKYVRKGVQDVVAQYAKSKDKDDNETAAIRFVTTVDSLQYKKVGFDITINGTTIPKESNIVYKKLYATGVQNGDPITYVPTDIDAASTFFNTFTINGISANGFDTEITVQTYWITQDGTKVLGDVATYTINGMMQ